MKSALITAILVHFVGLALSFPVNVSAPAQNDEPKGILEFEMEHFIRPTNFRTEKLIHRRGLANSSLALTNQISFYTINFKVGTPPQKASGVLDTGSSDLWLYDKVTGRSPHFDSNASSTYRYTNDRLFISYGSGPVMGNWGTDTVEFAKSSLVNATLGLVTRDRLTGSKIPGILGVGKIQNEATDSLYPNIPALLHQEGLIQKNAFSIALSQITAAKGSCIFGGLDTTKYTGPLWALPMAKDAHLAVKLSGVSFESAGNNHTKTALPFSNAAPNTTEPLASSFSAQALLDTGTSFMYLPDPAVDAIVNRLGAVYYPQYGIYFVPNMTESTPDLSFNFSGAEIVVPAREYIVASPLLTPDRTPMPYILTIFKSSLVRGYVILGDTFLRSCYVVFDLTDNVVGMAQANHLAPPPRNKTASSILPIVSSIPGSIPAPLLKF